MGLDKAKIKSGTLRAHLETLEAQKRTAQTEINQLDGAAKAYKGASRSIGQLMVMIQNQLESDELVLPQDPVELAKQLKLWVSRAQQMAHNLADKMTADGLVAQGRMQGIEQAIGVARKSIEIEDGKAAALEAVDDTGDSPVPFDATGPSRRPVGARPGPSIAASRKAEETASKALTKPRTRTRRRTRATPAN